MHDTHAQRSTPLRYACSSWSFSLDLSDGPHFTSYIGCYQCVSVHVPPSFPFAKLIRTTNQDIELMVGEPSHGEEARHRLLLDIVTGLLCFLRGTSSKGNHRHFRNPYLELQRKSRHSSEYVLALAARTHIVVPLPGKCPLARGTPAQGTASDSLVTS